MKTNTILLFLVSVASSLAFAETESEAGYKSHETELSANKGFAVNGGSIRYASFAASSTQNIYSSDSYSYSGAGCISNSGGSTIFLDESLNLPLGSVIVSVGYFFNDANNGGSSLQIYNFDTENGLDVLSTVSPDPTSGFSSAGEFLWFQTSFSESNVARLTMGSSPSASACMIRIGYIPYNIADDVIFAHVFEY